METSIYHSETIYNRLKEKGLCQIFSHIVIKHIMSILMSVFTFGYKGKTVNFAKNSPCHRTTIAHFFNDSKWDDGLLESILKASVIKIIYEKAAETGEPVFCIVDDTIASKTKPSSHALHPIEDAYFHQSHLKGKQDYGHQAVSVMLSCGGIVLNYAICMYDKTISKIQIVLDVVAELPKPPVISYFLCDSWYSCAKIMDAFVKKGFYTIGALKTNRVIYPCGIKQQVGQFALFLRETDPTVHLVTVGGREYYVYRYEGSLNDLENAVVILSYPKDAFQKTKALRVFISTDVSLSTDEILGIYTKRWPIEVFFRTCKNKLAFDQYQIRSSKGIQRFWLLMSLAHFFCCCEGDCIFEKGYALFRDSIHKERISFIYECGAKSIPLEDVLAVA